MRGKLKVILDTLQDLPDTTILQPIGIPFYSLSLGDLRKAVENLSALLEAAGPITKHLAEIPQGECLWPPAYTTIYTDDLRKLAEAVQEV